MFESILVGIVVAFCVSLALALGTWGIDIALWNWGIRNRFCDLLEHIENLTMLICELLIPALALAAAYYFLGRELPWIR